MVAPMQIEKPFILFPSCLLIQLHLLYTLQMLFLVLSVFKVTKEGCWGCQDIILVTFVLFFFLFFYCIQDDKILAKCKVLCIGWFSIRLDCVSPCCICIFLFFYWDPHFRWDTILSVGLMYCARDLLPLWLVNIS